MVVTFRRPLRIADRLSVYEVDRAVAQADLEFIADTTNPQELFEWLTLLKGRADLAASVVSAAGERLNALQAEGGR